ncbi:hypothetical protein OSTOST_01832 [Ostertagia ostertagi]
MFIMEYVRITCFRPTARFLFGKGSYILIALYAFTAVDYGAVCFFNFGPSLVKDFYFSEEMRLSYQLNIIDIGYLGPAYMLNGEVQWLDLSGLLNVSVVIGFTFALIPFCGIGGTQRYSLADQVSTTVAPRHLQKFYDLRPTSVVTGSLW